MIFANSIMNRFESLNHWGWIIVHVFSCHRRGSNLFSILLFRVILLVVCYCVPHEYSRTCRHDRCYTSKRPPNGNGMSMFLVHPYKGPSYERNSCQDYRIGKNEFDLIKI